MVSVAESRGGGNGGFDLTLSQRGGSIEKHPCGYTVLGLCVRVCVRARVWCSPSLSVCVVLAEAG